MSVMAAHRGRVLYQLARADFLERVRRFGFLLTLAFAIYLCYAATTGHLTLRMGDTRGIFNSAWIGALMALIGSTFVPLAGFYIVKNTVERDRHTRVGQILASTPISRFMYVIGKTVSNFAVLAVMVGILALSGFVMQLWRGEDRHVEIVKLLAPTLLVALPAMAVVAALAVLFETIPLLRSGFGDIVYFFAWSAGIAVPMSSNSRLFDVGGIFVVTDSLMKGSHLPLKNSGFSFSLNYGNLKPVTSTFRWEGIPWTAGIVLGRIAWIGVALLLVFLASLLFDRFDPAKGKPLHETPDRPSAATTTVTDAEGMPAMAPLLTLTEIGTAQRHFRIGPMLAAETRLMLKGQKWWWYIVAAGLLIASAAVPAAEPRGIVLACAWLWPVILWSGMGVRESRDRTDQVLFSAPHPIARQLPAVWMAGITLALLTGCGFAVRLVVAGNMRGLLAWLVGALFIPTLALALGVWSGSSKPFVVLYTLLWYVGPLHSIPQLDFMGSAPATAATNYPATYLVITCGLILVAIAGRKRQLQT